jgi:tetratricopeptide (TPR) repeat protein
MLGWLQQGYASFKFVIVDVLPVTLVAAGIWAIKREIYSKRIEIMPLVVPPSLADLGFTGEALARRLRDEFEALQRSVGPRLRRELGMAAEGIDFTVPGVGLSLATLVQMGRRVLRLPNQRVTGEVMRERLDGPVTLRLRFGHGMAVTAAEQPASVAGLDAALREAAIGILDQVAPYVAFGLRLQANEPAPDLLQRARRMVSEAGRDRRARALALHAIGRVYDEKLSQWEEANRSYRDALRLEPRLAMSRNNVGILLMAQGRVEEAERWYLEAIRADPNYAYAHYNLGLLLHQQGRLAEAERSYREAIQLDPDYAAAHNNLGLLLNDLGQRDHAETSFREAIRLNPSDAAAHNELGHLLSHQGRREQAERSLREAIRLDPDYADARYNLGSLLSETGRREEAEHCFREALRLSPEHAPSHFNLALLLEDGGRLDEALAHAEAAERLDPALLSQSLARRIRGARLTVPLAG